MAILDNQLEDDQHLPLDPTLGGPMVSMASPDLLNVDNITNGGPITAPVSSRGLTLEQLSEVANMSGPGGFAQPFGYIPQSELIANQRYPIYGREIGDLEDINSQSQTALGNLGRGLIKFAGRTTGSFAEGMFTIPNLISSIKSGDASKLSGDPNGIEGTIDGWMESMDNFIPTYQSAFAKAHPFRSIIPFTEGSSYFWGEKFMPNLGFMAGSFASAAVQDVAIGAATGAIGEIPLVASQLGKASLYLNKLFSAETMVGKALGATQLSQLTRLRQLGEELGKSQSQMFALEKLAAMSAAASLGTKARYGMAILGASMNEAGTEGRNGYKMIKEELINQYKFDHFGQGPDAAAMEEIESHSTAGMNTRFGINMALLTASNGLFFGNAFKSIIAGGGPVTGGLQKTLEEFGKIGLKEGSLDVFERKATESIAGKAWNVVKPKLATMFTEGVAEEGGQFAAERGTYDYYTRQYKSKDNKDTRDDLNEIIKSTVYGLNQQFGTQEGIENMVIGALTGLVVGTGQSLFDNYKKQGVDTRLGNAINVLNTQGLTNTIKQMYDNTQTSAFIAKEMQEANASGDVFKYKNLQDTQFFSFVQSRIPSGMHDVTIEQLKMLKDLPKDQFESMFQLDFDATNKKTVGEYVDNLIDKANEIKETSDLINKTFKNPFKNAPNFDDVNTLIEAGNYNTFEDYKTDLAYYAVTSKNVDGRLQSIQTSVSNVNPLISNSMLAQLTSREGLTELRDFYEQKAASLSETIDLYTNAAERKEARDQIKALRTNAEKINLLLKEGKVDDKTFEKLLNFELNGQDATKADVVPLGSANDLRNYGVDINKLGERKEKASKAYDELTTKEGFEKYFEEADQIAKEKAAEVEEEEVAKPEETEQLVVETAYDFVNKGGEKEAVQEGREYEIGKSKLAKLSKIADDRWQVTSPDGTITSFKSEEAAKAALEDINSDLADLTKVRIIGLNEDSTIKVEDVNGDIKNIAPDQLSGYEKIQTDQEKLQKFADDVNKEQAEIELNSGDVAIVDTPITKSEDEGRLVDANILFERTTSEKEEDIASFKPHQLRAVEFLNNVGKFPNRSKIRAILVTPNQEDSLGLTGLTEMQYGVPKDQVPDATTVDFGLVAAVYVEQDGSNVYFVDKDGKRVAKVGETMDMSKLVYSTMPTTDLRYKDKSPKYRAEQKALAEAKQAGWKIKRAELFKEPGYKVYNFTVSKGIPELTKGERNHIGETLVPESVISTQEGLIQVSNTGFIFHKGKQVKVSIGHPYIQYGDTLQNVRSRNFSAKEAKGVFEVLKKISEEVNSQLAAGKPIKINRLYSTYLQNVLYWKSKGASSNNQIFINTNTMNLELGKEKYDLTKIAESEDQIVDQLKSVYQNLNRDTLTKKFHEKFLEPHIGPDGNLIISEWDNYQSYLLADKFPNGSSRPVNETPLSTNVAKITDAVPYNFKQKYAVLEGMELPEQLPSTPATATTTPTSLDVIGEYNLDGTTENIYDVSTGPVLFTAKKTKDGLFIKIDDNQTVTDIANTEAKVLQIVDYLKKAERFDATKDDLGIVKDYLKIQIANDIKSKDQAAPTSTAATVTQTDLASGKVTGTVTTSTESLGTEAKPSDVDFSKSKPPKGSQYRRLGTDKTERMTDAEIQLFKEWALKNVPGIPFEILDRIITTHDGEKAWGVFENGVAKFYRGGQRGTEYHEIGEGIWNVFLSPQEQQVLLDEFKAKAGKFKDRESGKMLLYEEATDQQAKERIMDDFADFRLGKLPARNIGEAILKFFRDIIAFVKSFVNKPSAKEQLFKAIDTGKYKDYTMPESAKSLAPKYRAVEGLSERDTNDVVRDMTARFFAKVFGTNKSLYEISNLTAPELFDAIKAEYEEENKIIGENSWLALVNKTKDFLRTFKIEFNKDDILDINAENVTNRMYAAEAFTTDWKKSSPYQIKLLIGTLLETVPTNQVDSSSLSLPEPSYTDKYFFKLVNFSRAFATVIDKLANTTKVSKMVDKLVDLSKYDSNYVRLFQRLGGTVGENGGMVSIDFSKFEPHDWRLFVQFYQTFTKQRPNALVQYVSGDEVYTSPADQFTISKQTKTGWMNNLKDLSTDPNSLVRFNKGQGRYKVMSTEGVDIESPQQMVDFLNRIGVTYTMDTYLRLKPEQRDDFVKSVGSIHAYFGKTGEVATVSGKTLGIDGPLDTLADLYVRVENPIQDTTYPNVEGENTQAYTENNAPSLLANEFNEADTVQELKSNRTELNDVFSTNALFFKKGGMFYNKDGKKIKTLVVSHIGGTKNQNTNVDKSTTGLTLGNRFTQEINQNLNGNYHILIPADGSTEWMMNLGNNISFKEVAGGLAFAKVYTIFQGYLKDDIALALDFANREKLANVTDNFKNLGKAKELRFFKDILKGKTLSGVNNLIINGATQDEINTYIKDNAKAINTDVEAYIKRNVAATNKILVDNYKLTNNPNKTVTYEDLDGKFAKAEQLNKNKLSQDDVTDILTFARINYIINNIEFHKILFGDPYQFAIKKGKLDETKRVKSFLSGRKTTFDDGEFNTFHNQTYNNAGGVKLTENDPGHHLFKPYMNTVTLKDVTVRDRINEADAGSWIMDHVYRSVKLRNGQWDLDSIAEANYQWNMAYTRRALDKRKDVEWTYGDNTKLKAHDDKLLSTPEPEFIREVLKPIVSGSKYGSNRIDLVLDKTSQMPLYYKDLEKYNLGDFYIKMWKEKAEYAIFESGRKVGAEQLFDLYDEETGDVNTAPFGKMIPVAWKTYGIQVENSYDEGTGQTLGSQPTKISSLDLFENGKPRTADPKRAEIIQKAYTRNVKALNNLFLENYNQLLKKLGVEDLGGVYNIVDPTAVSKSLEYEMLKRELDDNAIDTIRTDENGEFPIPFESSTAYVQIRDILYSMVDKAIGSPKVNGFPAVQVPVTMWEKSGEKRGVTEINGKKVFTDGTLKSYTKENRYMEILVPYWFKEQFKKAGFKSDEELLTYLNKPENESILKGIGFRIPNQAASSSLVFKIKGFLPQSMGKTVVLPSEITEIAGSDFDIDKLNMYLKNTYINAKGQLKQVPFFGYGEEAKEAIKKFILKEDLESIFNIDERIVNSVDDDYDSIADKLYKQSVENEYYESLADMLTLDENYDRLITPISDAGLKGIADELDGLRGVDETKIENRMLDGNFLTMLRHAFVIAKKWVGIGAVNITNHSLFQKIEGYIDPLKFSQLSDYERKIIGDGRVILPHNTVRINGQDRISLSGVLDRANKYISDNLSGFITSFVDVAKDPYILKILSSNNIISTAMFLTRIGTPVKTTALFLNQPIIKEYMNYLDSIGSSSVYSKKNLDFIRKKFPADRKAVVSNKIDMKNLAPNIKNYYAGTAIDNVEQQRILVEFLKYHKMGQFLFKFTQATNYDTTKFRSAEAMSKKRLRTTLADKTNIISSVGDVLNNSFVGEKANITENAINALSPILKLDQVQFAVITNKVLDPYKEDEYLGADDFDRVGNKTKTSFLDYIFLTRTNLRSRLIELLVDPYTAVVTDVAKAKKNYPDMEILQQLEQVSSDRVGGAKSLRLKANLKTAYDNNLYQGMMRELRDNKATNGLYNRIVDLAILQGTYQSAISIKNIIPIEDYSERLKDVVNSLASDLKLDNFSKVGAFQRNNWNDEAIFKKITDISPSFFGEGLNDLGEFVSEVEFDEFPTLEGISAEGVKQVLVLDRFDNFKDVASDYILVPRVVKNGNERIDIINGESVSRADFEKRKAIGDTSLNDVMGFQKVKYEDGTDFVRGSKYYYKAINLWGDGQYSTEMYDDNRESVFNNGTVHVKGELTNQSIIDYFDKKLQVVEENNVPLPAIPVQEDKQFLIGGTYYSLKPNGDITYGNGNIVKNQEVINQITARQQIQNGSIKVANYNGTDYFVLNDGKIIDATKDNFGKEPKLTDAEKEVILAKAITYKKTC